MHKSKILALLLAVVMVASMIVVPAYAEGEYTMTLTADKEEVAPGATVTLTLSIANNPGFMYVGAALAIPDGWTLTNVVSKGAETIEDEASEAGYLSGHPVDLTLRPYRLDACSMTEEFGPVHGDGPLYVLTLTAPEATGTYEFTLNPTGYNFDDIDQTNALEVTPVGCTVTVVEGEAAEVECEKCGAADWTEIEEGEWTGEELATGHYQLQGNQTLTAALEVSSDVCVDLNGYNITATGENRVFEKTAGTLVIMDSSEDENGTISGGKVAEQNDDGYVTDKNGSKHGGNIYTEGGDLYIYSGNITGGVATRGGNIYIKGGDLYMYGGTVSDGSAYRGGNIEVAGDYSNIYGGEITGGQDTHGAPNVIVSSGSTSGSAHTLNIYGGEITGGTTTNNAYGSVYSLYSTLYIYGGDISNDKAVYTTGYYSSKTSNSKAYTYIYGGTITGEVNLQSKGVALGANEIYNGVFSDDVSGYKTDCACVFGDTVWHYKDNCDCSYTQALADDTASQYIFPQTGEHTAAADEASETGYSCTVCGADCDAEMETPSTQEGECPEHGNQPWQAWDGVASDGHFFVDVGFTLTEQVTVKDGETLCLDLNGETVTAESTRMFLVEAGGTLTLMDSAEDGALQGTEIDESGAVVSSAGTFNLYSGTIQGGTAKKKGNIYGGNIYINGGSFNMYGGTVKDGTVINTSSTNAYGGNIYIVNEGTEATISGGKILNGNAGYRGGNIALNSGATMTITGDVTVEGGAAATYNSAGNGANIFVAGTSSLTIESGVTIGAAGEDNAAAANIIKATNATVVIKAGVATYEHPDTYAAYLETYTVYNTIKDEADVTYYVTYATVTDAVDAAGEGDTVNLVANATVDEIIELNGETLNLNGYILDATSGSVDATIGNVVDSTDGTGKVVGNVTTDNNEMQHIVVEGESYFEYVEIKDDYHDYEEGASQVKYYMYVDKAAANTMVEEALKEGTLQMGLLVTWNDGTEDREHTFVLDNEDLIEAYVIDFDSKMLVVTITGLENVTLLGCEATLVVPVEA